MTAPVAGGGVLAQIAETAEVLGMVYGPESGGAKRMRGVHSAVAELIAADKAYDNARANLDFATKQGKASDAMHFSLAVAKDRRATALSNIEGAST